MAAAGGGVRIRAGVLETIAAHAQRDAPLECCGLLVGAGDLVDEAVPARNVLADVSRYQLDPAAHFDLIRRLRGTARTIVGTYHSHPRTPAAPSPRDLAEAHYPDFVWLIVSLERATPDYRAYRIANGAASAVDLRVEG